MVPDLAGLRATTRRVRRSPTTALRACRPAGGTPVSTASRPVSCRVLTDRERAVEASRIIAVPRSDELAEAMMEPLPPGPGLAVLVIPIPALPPPVRGLGLVSATPTPSGCPAR